MAERALRGRDARIHEGHAGFGGQGAAIAGFNHLTGWVDAAAHGPYATITDSLSPRYVAFLIAAALLHRRRTGEGQHIDVSQIETGVYSLSEMMVRFAATGEVMERRGNRDERGVPHGVYPCRGDDRWIAIAIFSDPEWRLLRRAMGNPAFSEDPRFDFADGRRAHEDELDEQLGRWTRERDPHELAEALQSAGIEAGPVQTYDDLLKDPQLAHRGHFETLRHPHLGEMQFEHYAIRLTEQPSRLEVPGPDLGEQTEAVLCALLGFDRAEVARLRLKYGEE